MIRVIPYKLYGTGDIMGKYPEETVHRVGYTYLHGEAEDTSYEFGGYDICGFLKEIPDYTGIYPCIVEYPFGDVEGTIFLWYGDPLKYNGLVVLNSDKESYEDAKVKYDNKVYVL